MVACDIDLLGIQRGMVVAPAGCGKTQLLADALACHEGPKPILVLTHTNAGVVALRSRLDRAAISHSLYRLSTIDGWAIRLISMFPQRAGHDPRIVTSQRPNYPLIRETAARLLKAGHINDVLAASYSRLLVDEYQDCSRFQHALIYYASLLLPTCVVGDHMQAIFGFDRNDPLADWDKHVCGHFEQVGELDKPWRWIKAGAEDLGTWLLDARTRLGSGQAIDLRNSPEAVTWVQLDGTPADHPRQLEACKIKPPGGGSVLILGESTNPGSQRRFASQTPGAVTVEAVNFTDFVAFAAELELGDPNALKHIAEFAQGMMTNVGAADLVRRVGSILRGTARNEPSAAEMAAIAFERDRTYRRVSDLLVEINKLPGVRVYRPAVLHACLRALDMCTSAADISFYEAAVRMREQSRLSGRQLPRRAVGSTLLLKGLESEVAVILNGDQLDAKSLYVAMTRGSQRLVICSRSPVLQPA